MTRRNIALKVLLFHLVLLCFLFNLAFYSFATISYNSSAGSNNAGGATSITVNTPSGVSKGDALLMAVSARSGATISPSVVVATQSAVAVGTGPYSVAISPDGTYALVANLNSNSVTPLTYSGGTWSAGTAVTVGTNPVIVAISPDGTYALVTNGGSASVTPLTYAKSSDLGWIQLGSQTNTATNLSQSLFFRIAQQGEPASYLVNLGSSLKASAVVVDLKGETSAIPGPAQFSNQANASSATISFATLGTFSSSNGIDLAFGGIAYGGETTAAPSGYTNDTSFGTNAQSTGNGASSRTQTGIGYKALSSVTTVSSLTEAWSSAAENVGSHVFIKEQILDHYGLNITSPQTAGVCSTGTNTISAEDSGGAVLTGDASTVDVSTSDGTGVTFYTNGSCTTSTTQYTMTSGVANFYYKTSTPQIFQVTATKHLSTETGTSFAITVNSGSSPTSTPTPTPAVQLKGGMRIRGGAQIN